MRVSVHPGAEQDIQQAAEFYAREGSPALARRFVTEFKRVTQLLAQYPEMGSPRSNHRRGFSMTVFPYTIIYRASVDEVRILVVKHDRKRTGFGASRS